MAGLTVWDLWTCPERGCDVILTAPQQHYACGMRGHRPPVPVRVTPYTQAVRDGLALIEAKKEKARVTDPETSHAAARRTPVARDNQRGRTLVALARWIGEASAAGHHGELPTADRLAEYLCVPLNSVSTRLSELCEDGYIAVHELPGRSATGSSASRYYVTPKGNAWLVAAP